MLEIKKDCSSQDRFLMRICEEQVKKERKLKNKEKPTRNPESDISQDPFGGVQVQFRKFRDAHVSDQSAHFLIVR